MIKRVLYIIFIALLVGALTYFYFQVNQHSEVVDKTDLIEIVPNNPGIIIEIADLNSFAENENLNSEMWQSLTKIAKIESYANLWSKWDSVANTFSDLSNWSDDPAILSYHLVGNKVLPFFSIKFRNKATERTWKTLMQTKGLTIEKDYNGVNIYKYDNEIVQYAYLYNGYFALSASSILLEQSIRTIQNPPRVDEEFEALRKTRGKGVDMNIYVNYKRLHTMMEKLAIAKSSFTSSLSNLGNWGEYDYSVDESNLIFTGFSTYSSEDYWHIFSQQANVRMSIQDAIPLDSKGFMALSIDDIHQYRSDYESYLHHQGTYATYEAWIESVSKRGVDDIQILFDDLIEKEIAYRLDNQETAQRDESLVIIKTKSASSALERLSNVLSKYASLKGKQLNDYRSPLTIDSETTYALYNFPFDDSFGFLYGQAFADFDAKYFCFFDNYLIFGTDRNTIKKAITANILKQTLANDADFIDLFSSFSSKNSLFYFEKTNNIIPTIQYNLGDEFCERAGLSLDNTSNFYALAYQMISSDKYVYNSVMLNYNSELKDKPLTVWNSQLEGEPVGKPQFVKNHYSNENEICVQDDLHNLYLISSSGRVIWKKPIGEAIISEIHQVDFYKNGKLQLLFNTASKLWMLDRNGNFVERYPILLPSNAATGLSLFDYDKQRNYRIFIPTVDKHIYLYTKEGNINRDFVFGTTEYPLTMPIQFFRVQGKDYLVFADKNHVYILNRKGERRIKLKEQFSASPNNEFYLGSDERQFIATTNVDGQVMKVYFDGSVSKVKLKETTASHYFAMADLEQRGSSNFVIVDKDLLTVYNFRGRELYSKRIENAELSRPYFYKFASNVTKIGLSTKNKNEIYLLDGVDGELYKGFPLIGTSPFTIGFLATSSWRFNLIVGGESGALYNYKVK